MVQITWYSGKLAAAPKKLNLRVPTAEFQSCLYFKRDGNICPQRTLYTDILSSWIFCSVFKTKAYLKYYDTFLQRNYYGEYFRNKRMYDKLEKKGKNKEKCPGFAVEKISTIPYKVLKLVLFPALNFLLHEWPGDCPSVSVLSWTHTSLCDSTYPRIKEKWYHKWDQGSHSDFTCVQEQSWFLTCRLSRRKTDSFGLNFQLPVFFTHFIQLKQENNRHFNRNIKLIS